MTGDPLSKIRDLASHATSEAELHAAASAAWQAVAAAAKGISEPPAAGFSGAVDATQRTTATLHLESLARFLGDETLAIVVGKLVYATGARAEMMVWDGGRSLSLVLPDGQLTLRLSAVMSANEATGIARWIVEAP